MTSDQTSVSATAVCLFWLPLGADGNPAVRWGGRAYEAVVARREHRERLSLFHSALRVRLGEMSFVVEMAPAWGAPALERGVVGEGPVGLTLLGRSRYFRYEIRRWRSGVIPDVDRAVESPVDLAATDAQARALLSLTSSCPTPVWGRDQLDTGDMWNSNSLVSWLLTRVGLPADQLVPPGHGRAPGWTAGVRIAQRQMDRTGSRPLAACEAAP